MNEQEINLDRLDIALKEQFGYSRDYSKDIILKGLVSVDGTCITKPSFKVSRDSIISLDDDAIQKFVSRAGLKLEEAINYFNIDLNNRVCLDVGGSTGGFSDCMLQNNVKKIIAVDVGNSQLHSKIEQNSKVISLENTDIREFDKTNFLNDGEKIDFITIDVSFISVIKILDSIIDLLDDKSSMVILIKPQFEVGRQNVAKSGIVRNKKHHFKVIENIINYLENNNIFVKDVILSPIKGGKGNTEYLAYFEKNGISKKVTELDNFIKIKSEK